MIIEQYIGILFIVIGLYLLYILNPINVNPFLRDEADRVLNNNAEASEDWNSQGRVYRRGIELITTKDGRKKFVKTAKLVDSGILHN